MTTREIAIRALAARDSFETLTKLLHRAYAPFAAAGMNLTSASQSPADTQRRAAEGQCYVAEIDGRIVGTVTICGPYADGVAPWAASVRWFRDRDTAHFHQFAIDPDWQGRGLGKRLIAVCERWAENGGYRHIAVDVAEPAAALRALYARLGYAEVGCLVREDKNFRTMIMQKALDRSPLRDHLLALARYNVWATGRLFEHVDTLPDADYRRDVGLFFKSVHGTLNHLLLVEHELWRRRFAEGASPIVELSAEIESDRARLRERLGVGARAWLPLLESWTEPRLQGRIDYKRSNGQPASMPFAAGLAHVFNHGTHHRGQVTAALTAMGRECPVLDLAAMLQQESASA